MTEASAAEFPFMAALSKRKQSNLAEAWAEARQMSSKGLIPQAVAARLLNVSRQRICQLMEEKRLPVVRWESRDYTTLDGVAEFAKQVRPTGRPKLRDCIKDAYEGWKDMTVERGWIKPNKGPKNNG